MAANTCNQPPFNGNGTGAQADYVFGFEYINRADVEVYVGEPGNWTQFTEGNAANADEYQWQNDTTIRLNAATGTDNVLITRETDRCDPAVEFFAGTSIRAEDLNANQEQTLLLIQELANTLSENGMDQPPGSDGITLDDLEDVNITTTNERRWLRWDNTAEEWQDQPILQNGDDWVADDDHVVTSEAGDDRWLGIPGGDGTTITAGDGIVLDGAQISVDLADTNPGLQFTGGDLQVIGNSVTEDGDDVRLTNGPSNVTITGAGGINVTRTSATELTITDTADNNTTYDFGNTAVSGNARLRLSGSDGTNDDVTITAGTNITFANQSATGFTINATGGGTGGGNATVVADVAALNTAADGPPDDDDLFLLLDSTNLNADAASGDNDEDVNGLPMTEANGAPVGGYGGEIQVTLQWDNDNTRWQFIRWAVQEPDNRYVLEQGDTMTGPLIMDDTTIQITEGDDTLTLNWPTGTADRTISFPDAGGTVALTGDVPAAPNDSTITLTAGNGLTDGGDFTTNQATNETITFNVGAGNGITVNADDIAVNAANNTINVAAAGISVNQGNLTDLVAVAGDTMTGNLQMDGASVIADNGETVPDNNGNWDIQNSNVWQVPANRNINFPDNTAAPIPGQTGIFSCAGNGLVWTNANGGTWLHPGGTAQAGGANTIIPFYVLNATTILLGTQTVTS